MSLECTGLATWKSRECFFPEKKPTSYPHEEKWAVLYLQKMVLNKFTPKLLGHHSVFLTSHFIHLMTRLGSHNWLTT